MTPEKKSTLRFVPWLAVPLLIGVVLLLRSRKPAQTEAEAPEPAPVPVHVVAATVQPMETVVSALGSVVPRQGASAKVAVPAAGRLTAVFVKEGDRVRVGQVLAVVDRRSAEAQARSARAALEAAGQDTRSANLAVGVAASDQRSALAQAEASLATAQAERAGSIQAAQAALVQARSDARKAGLASNPTDLHNAVGQAQLALDAAKTESAGNVAAARNAADQAQTDLDKTRAGSRPQEIQQAQANLAQAQATLSRAKIETTRAQRLLDKGIIARRQFEDAQTAEQVANDAVKSAQAQLDLVRAGSRPEDIQAAELRAQAARKALDAVQSAGAGKIAQAQAALALAQSTLQQTAPQRNEDVTSARSRLAAAEAALAQVRKSGDLKVAQAQAALKAARSGWLNVTAKRADAASKRAAESGKAADLATAEAALSQTEVRSPISGIVTRRVQNVGETADPATPLLEIAEPGALDVLAQLPSFDAAHIAAGQQAWISSETAPGKNFAGRVESVGTTDPQSGLRSVRINVFGAGSFLSAGSLANVRIVTYRKPAALVIPQQTLLTREGHSVVMVAQGETAKEVSVQTGVRTGDRIEILRGLPPGARVISDNSYELEDGAAIRVVKP